jgi:glycosyltransferase involved in cell wall biosynthesis
MKFSIVTPVYNGAQFIAETIESVLSQAGDFEIEYIIQDGGSTDRTLDIARSFELRVRNGSYPLKCNSATMYVHSEKDAGMYDAINKGFAKATGDIYAWINSDDFYLPGAFDIMARSFRSFPDIKWLKGITSFVDEKGKHTDGQCMLYEQRWLRMGIYGRNAHFVHQDSTFWKRELWEKVGGAHTVYHYAGDYDLWIRFAEYEPLWSLNHPVSCFRTRTGQITSDMHTYRNEQYRISQERGFLNKKIKMYFWLWTKLRTTLLAPVLIILYPLVFTIENKCYIEIATDGTLKKCATKTFLITSNHA